jgi:hypothetical protein
MQMEMYMKDNGKMINPMELESINITMELFMKANGRMISKMEKVYKLGLMAKNMKDTFLMDRNQAKVC